MLTEIVRLDELLNRYRSAIGRDFPAYRHHAYRVVNLCLAFSTEHEDRLEKIVIAAALHDIGIWTDGTFDYLEPSARVAMEHLAAIGRSAWASEISSMIFEHHKIRPPREASGTLIDAFRRADWTDVTMGVAAFGTTRALVRRLYGQWPSEGFHKRLVQLTARRWRTHPLSPLPMLKL